MMSEEISDELRCKIDNVREWFLSPDGDGASMPDAARTAARELFALVDGDPVLIPHVTQYFMGEEENETLRAKLCDVEHFLLVYQGIESDKQRAAAAAERRIAQN